MMEDFSNNPVLTEHISLEVLEELLEGLHSMIGMRVTINNCAGERVVASSDALSTLCTAKYENPETERYCRACTQMGAIRASEIGGPVLYRCYAGLAAVAIPVIVENQIAALLMTSGFHVESESMKRIEKILDVEGQEYPEEIIDQAPFYHTRRIMDIASILSLASKYISEAGLRNSIQAQLHEKSLELITQMQIRSEAEKLASQAQFKALQSQINPHFLFNTLNAVSQLAILERADTTAEAIFSLSSLLRRSLQQNSGIASLQEEVNYINKYFKIKKMMYRDRIEFITEIDESCLHLLVPAFTIQPLVENSLLHGLEPKEEGGRLLLEIRRIGKFVSVQIKDDGLGFTKRKLDAVKKLKKTYSSSETTGIGIENVIYRLQDFFGDRFYWEIDSEPGRGTSVTLFLPETREVSDAKSIGY